MKIGIATFQSGDNYGAVLQAYALQSFLRDLGHTVELIRYCTMPSVPLLRRWIAKTPAACIRKCEAEYKRFIFRAFRSAYLVETQEIFISTKEIESLADRYELLITGSDQVWNPQWLDQVTGFWDLYFLSFGGENTRRVSFGASFGHSSLSSLSCDWINKLGGKLRRMDAISVREPSGVGLVRALCGREDAIQVADPTILLNRDHYEKLIGSSRPRKVLFNYMLHGMEQDADAVSRKIAAHLNLKVVKCNMHKTALHQGYMLPSPIEWLRLIHDADFVVTNSFHGVIFCLLFNIPFLALLIQGPTSPMNTRIIELLKAVELTNRIIDSREEYISEILHKPIKWDNVNQRVFVMKTAAVDFLNAQLEINTR